MDRANDKGGVEIAERTYPLDAVLANFSVSLSEVAQAILRISPTGVVGIGSVAQT